MKEMNRCGSYFNSTYIILLKTSMIGTCHATIDVLLSTNSESMNQRFFFTIFFLLSFKMRQNSSIEIKKYIYVTIHFHKKKPTLQHL